MSLDCLNETIRFDNATLQSVETTKSSLTSWFINSCVLSSSLVANGWLLAVSWGSTHIDGIFKYPVCYLALCDAWLALVRITQLSVHLFVDASTYLHYCGVLDALSVGSSNAMFSALIPTPVQRCLFFVDVPPWSDHARLPRSVMVFCAVLLCLSMAPPVAGILAMPNWCADSPICPQLPFNWLFFVLEISFFLLSYVASIVAVLLFVWKVKQMTSLTEQLTAGANIALPPSEVNTNRDILAMAVVQTVNPILLTAPIAIISLGWLANFASDSSVMLVALSFAQFNPLVDALSAIYYIKPYRRLAQKTAKRICQSIIKPNAVNATPAVVVNVIAASPGNVENMHISFTAPAPIQPT